MAIDYGLVWRVTRVGQDGSKGYKYFETREAAEDWMKSKQAKEDEYYGYIFVLDRM